MTKIPQGKYTLFTINILAMTSRQEIEVVASDLVIMKIRGKRGTSALRTFREEPNNFILLDGWDLPVKADTDGNTFMGNACFNFVAETPEIVRELIEKATIPASYQAKAKSLFHPKGKASDLFNPPQGELLYPELETGHSVIGRIRARKEV